MDETERPFLLCCQVVPIVSRSFQQSMCPDDVGLNDGFTLSMTAVTAIRSQILMVSKSTMPEMP